MHLKIVQALDQAGVPYSVHFHKLMRVAIRGPRDFAEALGYEVGRISKSLLLRATDRETFCVVVVSSDRRVALERIAEFLQVKRVQMANKEELLRILDYPTTGVSPIGAGSVPVLMDERLMLFSSVLIGAGAVGIEIEISPDTLKKITGAVVMDIAQD
jgi:Cys-tRNA(Pro)/Cys-tRNA(Cys) deacylase